MEKNAQDMNAAAGAFETAWRCCESIFTKLCLLQTIYINIACWMFFFLIYNRSFVRAVFSLGAVLCNNERTTTSSQSRKGRGQIGSEGLCENFYSKYLLHFVLFNYWTTNKVAHQPNNVKRNTTCGWASAPNLVFKIKFILIYIPSSVTIIGQIRVISTTGGVWTDPAAATHWRRCYPSFSVKHIHFACMVFSV